MSQTMDRPTGAPTQEIPSPRVPAEAAREEVTPAPEPPPTGDPLIIGLPAFLVGAVALGLVDVNFAPVAAAGAAIPIIMTATSIGLLVAAIWAARLAQNAVAGVLGIFFGFWISFAAVSVGLGHNWFAVLPAGVARTVEVFLIAWIVVIGLLTLGTLRLPIAYTALFALVEAALVVTLIATIEASVGLVKTAGWIVFGFAAIGAYVFLSSLSTATGGRALPLGPPIMH